MGWESRPPYEGSAAVLGGEWDTANGGISAIADSILLTWASSPFDTCFPGLPQTAALQGPRASVGELLDSWGALAQQKKPCSEGWPLWLVPLPTFLSWTPAQAIGTNESTTTMENPSAQQDSDLVGQFGGSTSQPSAEEGQDYGP
ncbi:hypothetical protein NDU88_005863 [Pleurodeles waltl]|uniref:Uncharacterized protein n=1 Tax=Pleurodeles waltl TaxID=8319 RepID=A0AAV7RMY5_PLEWA|nr:hypothetical protein NDU88_005863 [Pleurodeles waltl]